MEENSQNRHHNPFWSSEHYSFSKYAVIAFAVFVLFMTFISNDNLIRWFKARAVLHEQEATKARLKEENAAKQARYDALTSCLDSLEAHAREAYQFAEPGDDVYLIDE